MQSMPPIMRAVLFEFQSRGIVLLVFLARVVPILAFGAFERDDQSVFFLRHYSLT
jgi:hypothetical protein